MCWFVLHLLLSLYNNRVVSVHIMSDTAKRPEKYCVRYQNSSSKRWDGKIIWVNANWMEELYVASELVSGLKVKLPWANKGGRMSYWNAVVVDPQSCTASENVHLTNFTLY